MIWPDHNLQSKTLKTSNLTITPSWQSDELMHCTRTQQDLTLILKSLKKNVSKI